MSRLLASCVVAVVLACAAATSSSAQAIAPPASTGSADAAWTACLSAPKRACVLDRSRQLALSDGKPPERAILLRWIADAQMQAGLKNDAAVTFGQALEAAQ